MIVYLDNNATTKVAPEVVEAIQPFWTEVYGNPSSIHSFGAKVKKPITKARQQVASLLNASESEIVFTSGGSESDNLAILGALQALGGKKRHVITSRVEHPAVDACLLGETPHCFTQLCRLGEQEEELRAGIRVVGEERREHLRVASSVRLLQPANQVGFLRETRAVGPCQAEVGA